MTIAPPEGTRYTLPGLSLARHKVIKALKRLYHSWGYEPVEVPAIERYDPAHPAAAKSFKLSDRDSGVLALRADFTPAIARLVKLHYGEAAAGHSPKRFQYCGALWQAINPDMARTREFTQIGLELIGVNTARADAELIHLARESVREVGLAPRVEIGNPGFVRVLFDLADVPEAKREALAQVIDHKDMRSLQEQLDALKVAPDLRQALLAVPDLYGDLNILSEARRVAPWPETRRSLDRLEAILAEFEDSSELLLDLGMARRLSYYTGMTFRAYTFDFGQPLLGGGRYDGALLPYAAGFAIGLERLLSALPPPSEAEAPLLLSLDDVRARLLRAHGFIVERALDEDPAQARAYAKTRGISYLLTQAGLEPLVTNPPALADLNTLLEGDQHA